MLLFDLLSRYAECHDISPQYVEQLWVHLGGFERFTGKRLATDDLARDGGEFAASLLNRHLKQMRSDGLSPRYRKGRRANVLVLWNYAADEGLCCYPPRRKLMTVKVPDLVVEAWTWRQVRDQLLPACDNFSGYYRLDHANDYAKPIPRREYWRSFVMAGWDGGFRGCDQRSLRREWIPPDGCMTMVAVKTGKRRRVKFKPETIEAIDRAGATGRACGGRDVCWPIWRSLDAWRRQAQKLVEWAGLPGSIGWLRRSAGTAVEAMEAGTGHRLLGNTREIFERHYQAEQLLPYDLPETPSLL